MSKDSPKSQQSGIASRANDVAKQAADALFPVHLDRGSTFDLNMDRRMEARAIISRILEAEYGDLEKAAIYEKGLGLWTCLHCETSYLTEDDLAKHLCPGRM
jgi:hypothetical protein